VKGKRYNTRLTLDIGRLDLRIIVVLEALPRACERLHHGLEVHEDG